MLEKEDRKKIVQEKWWQDLVKKVLQSTHAHTHDLDFVKPRLKKYINIYFYSAFFYINSCK